jgi:outer membrane lipopolysaccharide assembly protein LptE/RlpB
MRAMKRLFRACLSAAAALLLSGCASEYQLGTTLPEDCRDVYVPAILNESGEPRAATELRRALEKEIRREGTLHIVSDEAYAATRLDVAVVKYEQEATAYNRANTQSPTEYRMALTARVSFVKLPRAAAGEAAETPIFGPKEVRGTETFTGGADAVANKMSCLPQTAKNLAETIVDGCISPWLP